METARERQRRGVQPVNIKRNLALSGGLMAALLLTLAILWTGFNMMLLPVGSTVGKNLQISLQVPELYDRKDITEEGHSQCLCFSDIHRLLGLDKDLLPAL